MARAAAALHGLAHAGLAHPGYVLSLSVVKIDPAGALANAETFGGEDYVGFHTAMAMLPALEMTRQLPADRQALPILKVLYRNSQQIQQYGGAAKKTLRERHAAEEATVENVGLAIRDACRVADAEALAVLAPHIDHIVQVSDAEVAAAMRALFTDTHNVAEGAGAAALAAALQERDCLQGLHVGLALTGGNVDAPVFARTLAE